MRTIGLFLFSLPFLQLGKEGLNLTAASACIIMEPSLDPTGAIYPPSYVLCPCFAYHTPTCCPTITPDLALPMPLLQKSFCCFVVHQARFEVQFAYLWSIATQVYPGHKALDSLHRFLVSLVPWWGSDFMESTLISFLTRSKHSITQRTSNAPTVHIDGARRSLYLYTAYAVLAPWKKLL